MNVAAHCSDDNDNVIVGLTFHPYSGAQVSNDLEYNFEQECSEILLRDQKDQKDFAEGLANAQFGSLAIPGQEAYSAPPLPP